MSKLVAIFLPCLGGGGAERVALATAIDLARRGHRVDLVLIEAKGELLSLVPAGVRVVDLAAPRILGALRPLANYLRDAGPDAIHALMWPTTIVAILARWLARSRARLVVSDHTILSRHVAGTRARRMLRWTTRIFYPWADRRIAVSARVAEDLAMLSGLARERFDLVANPISPPATIATSDAVERLWGAGGKRILTIGNLKPEKNHRLLLRAFAALADQQAGLMIVGAGPLKTDLKNLADELGIADRVILPGFAVDPWPYLASADLFVLSSDYEGYGLVLVEALRAGLPVVSTDCDGPGEILDQGRFGRLVAPGDADALTGAIATALGEKVDKAALVARAEALSAGSLDAYAQLVLGEEAA